MNLYDNQNSDFPNRIIVGIDEAGRGPIAGPVVIASVILDFNNRIPELNDSKKLSEKKREQLFSEIIRNSLDFKIAFVNNEMIDKINILQATLYGMTIVFKRLTVKSDICLIDGNKIPPELNITNTYAVIKGDAKYASIAAASILAKVSRDRFMKRIHKRYPQYDFLKNKGYPTAFHKEIIQKYGICPYHRKSFSPVKQLFADEELSLFS